MPELGLSLQRLALEEFAGKDASKTSASPKFLGDELLKLSLQ